MTAAAPWREIADLLGSGRHVFVVRVVENTEHSPGTRGAMLWRAVDGPPRGTIGGGVMELRLLERGAEWLAERRRRFLLEELHHRGDAAGTRSGLICAGRQTNVSALLGPKEDGPVVRRIAERLDRDLPVGWRVGADGVHEAREVDHAGDSLRIERTGEWEVRELLFERRRVAVFGAGHCGAALARTMSGLGWRVDVWDTRPAIATDLRRSLEAEGSAGIVVHEVADLADGGPRIAWPRWTPAVVMTTNLAEDVRALHGLLGRRSLPFVGVMGAPAKLGEIRRRLAAAGWGEEDLARIVAPVGLPVGSDTPAEIAISVAAQLLERRGEWIGADLRGGPAEPEG